MDISTSSILKKILLLILIFAGLIFAKEFLMPITLGGIIATLFLPFSKWMEGKKIPRAIAVVVCLISFLAIIAGVVILLGWQISQLAGDFAILKERLITTGVRIQLYIFNHLGISAESQWKILKDHQSSVTGSIPFMAGSLAGIASNFILILVYLCGLLYYRGHIKTFLVKLSATSKQGEIEKIVYSATNVSQQYLVGLSKMIVCLWIMYGIGFSILGVENALFFAILCGLLEIIPFVGNLTGTSITVLVAAVQGASPAILVGIIITYGIIQLIQGWVLEPFIVGSQVKINPLFTIIALIIGELTWGIAGVFIAIPITAMFKIVCDHIESLKPLGFLIGKIERPKDISFLLKKNTAI